MVYIKSKKEIEQMRVPAEIMKEVLKDIQDGTFAKNWLLENQINRPYFNAQKRIHREHQIETVGADLRKMMCWLKK